MSPVVHPYTFGLVGVSPVTLPYTPVSIFCTRLRQKTPTQKIFLSMHVYSTIPSTVQYLTIKYRASVPSTNFFNYIVSTIPSLKCMKLSPHAGVDLTPRTTMLSSTTGRGRLNFSVYFCFLHHFCPCLLATSRFFSIEQLHENSQNSAHRLNYPSHPTPPPCQQQQAAACIVWL